MKNRVHDIVKTTHSEPPPKKWHKDTHGIQFAKEQHANNRVESHWQSTIQAMADNSPRVIEGKHTQDMANQFVSAQSSPFIQTKTMENGLPPDLKSGAETLSGLSLDDVKVHYNSSKPAQLKAHAFAQGNTIHLAPGQNKHLPHETWHVVQQKQGRVKPTTQLKNGISINTSEALEKEADQMGAKASGISENTTAIPITKETGTSGGATPPVQRALKASDKAEIVRLSTKDDLVEWLITAIAADDIIEAIDYWISQHREYADWRAELIERTNSGDDEEDNSGSESEQDDHDHDHEAADGSDHDNEEDELEAFNRRQEENKPIVTEAVTNAIAMIDAVSERAGNFRDNLLLIKNYLTTKLAHYDENHIISSPEAGGNVNELAHSKANGTIELFRGFFELSAERKAEILIHEAVHSVLHVTDHAYDWQSIFRFLPEATQLQNPDSYVAKIRSLSGKVVNTPNSGNDENDRIIGLMEHVCFRGLPIVELALTQIERFAEAEPPQPLRTIKAFKHNYDKAQLKALLILCKAYATAIIPQLRPGKIVIRTKDPAPATFDAAEVSLNAGVTTVDFINSAAAAPFVVMLAKVFSSIGAPKANAIAAATSLNELASKGHMDTGTLLSKSFDG